MSYLATLRSLGDSPEQLELAYQQAMQAGEADDFAQAVETSYAEAPTNLLYAAWHYRLAHAAARVKRRVIAWSWAIPLAIANGLILWLLSDEQWSIRITNRAGGVGYADFPAVALLAAPVSAMVILVYLTIAGNKGWRRAFLIILGLATFSVYVLLAYRLVGPRVFQEQYLSLMVLHLGLLAWAGIGVYLLASQRDAENRFAFLIKSLEVAVMAGLFAIAGALFTGITFGLFQALGIEPPDAVIRLFLAGGAGVIVVLAVALLYDPSAAPAQQSFDEGLGKLVATLMRFLLPLTLLVLVVYLGFIPFNFRQPFENREVLVVYNAMLFAVMALLVGATPVFAADLSQRTQAWLRRGIVALAALALIVSVYALAAILYRTAIDRLTPNRLTFIGWNLVNIGILAWLLVKQWRAGRERWLPALHETFAAGMVPYVAWTLVVIVVVPWLFRIDDRNLEALPVSIQRIAYEQPYPILLKCYASPHVYLLEDGAKRWVKDIPTFEASGFEWQDVEFVLCDDLAAVADGPPIPSDAGPPPRP